MKSSFPELNPSNKVICPYISTAGGSFQNEISYVCSNAFKKLQDLCKKYGGCFQPIDNRKTLLNFRPTEDFSLLQSFDLISRSRPFYIFVIGDHYGPYCGESELPITEEHDENNKINDFTMTKRNLITAISHGHSWLREKSFCNSSLLELEIEFAALQYGSSFSQSHCHFYFHDKHSVFLTETSEKKDEKTKNKSVETCEAQEKLSNLKDRLIDGGYNVRFFHDKESLDKAVFEDWSNVVNLIFENELDENTIGKFNFLISLFSLQKLYYSSYCSLNQCFPKCAPVHSSVHRSYITVHRNFLE